MTRLHFAALAAGVFLALSGATRADDAAPAASPASGQVSLQDALAACAGVKKDKARLACFESLTASVAPSAPVAETQVAETPELEAASRAAAVASTPVAAPVPVDQGAGLVVLRADDPKLRAAPAASSNESDNRIIVKRRKREPFTATVKGSKKNNLGVLFVELDTGEIFRDTQPADRPLVERGTVVNVYPGFTGGWFADLPDEKGEIRKVKVREVYLD